MNRRAHIAVLGGVATACASTTLSALFADPGWMPHVIGVIAAVTLGGELGAQAGRRLGATLALRAVGGITGAVLFIAAVFAHPVSFLGFLPWRASLGYVSNDWRAGTADMHDLSPKVPSHLGLTLFVVVGVGAVAFAVNMLVSRAALAGLPLLTMFVVPVALAPGGVGLLPFVLAAGSYLVLLAAEGRERAERWGRTLPARRDNVAAGYGQAGRRIGTAAVALAVFLPLVVPGLHANRLITNGSPGFGSGPGGTLSTALSPLAEIKGRLTVQARSEYFTYTSTSGPQYTRIVVDDYFDGSQFLNSGMQSPQRATGLQVAPHGLSAAVARQPVKLQITMKNLREQYLPVPIPLSAVGNVPDKWRYDDKTDTIFSAHSDTTGLSYTAEALDLKPTADQLRSAAPVVPDPYFEPYLQFPSGLDAEFAVLDAAAQKVTASGASAYDKAKLLEKWFSTSGGFVYDTQGPTGLEQNALTEFLQKKHGYCVQFASTMALMARLLGIPSRVDVGFTGGTLKSPGVYSVSSTDSHAWPELYFEGVGWIRFEPTPSTGTVTPPSPVDIPAGAPHPEPFIPTPFHAVPQTYVAPTGPFAWGLLVKASLAVGVLILLAVPSLAARWRRRRSWALAGNDASARAHAAWREVLVAAENLGHRFEPGLSIRGTAAVLAERADMSRISRSSLQTIAQAEELSRYSRTGPLHDSELESTARVVVDSLVGAARRLPRVRSIVLPPETLRIWRVGVGSATASAFEFVDRVIARVTGIFTRGVPGAAR
ncbi:MAG: hypothetical protein QOF57_1220 [Frankiaceae bacterium]|nr:hypothetical protein [Frankiaceae bacterium]